MNADTNPTEGDLAVVYRSEIQNMTTDTETQFITFPDTVTLSEAFTSSAYNMMRAVDSSVMFEGNIQLDQTSFRFDGWSNTGDVRVSYTSVDGINYTRTQFTGSSGDLTNPVDLGTVVKCSYPEGWNDALGYFMQVGETIFEGLFEYNGTQYNIIKTQLNAVASDVYKSVFYGSNGVETGTLSDFSNLTDNELVKRVEIWNVLGTDNGMTAPESCENLFSSSSINSIPLLDTSNTTNMNYMFSYCANLQTIPLLNTSKVVSMFYMFNGCANLQIVPLLDTSKVSDMRNMFANCTNLQSVPLLDMSSATNVGYMFADCTNLQSVPLFDTNNVTDIGSMFNGCTNLQSVPLLDTSSVTNMSYMFKNCTNLSDDSLNNILMMCVNSKVSSNYKTLSSISLSEEQAQKCTTLSNYQAFLDAGWTTGY